MSSAVSGPVKYARALQSRPFAFLWAGQTISALGDGTFYIALAWQVLLLTGSGIAMAGVTVAGIIPQICFFIIGGITADRISYRLVMLYSDITRAIAALHKQPTTPIRLKRKQCKNQTHKLPITLVRQHYKKTYCPKSDLSQDCLKSR